MDDQDSRMSSEHHVLMVEGQDDKHVVSHICQRYSYKSPFISDKDDVNQLLESISTELKAPGRKAVGILVDANDDLQARWTSIKDRLSKVDIIIPKSPDPDGTIIEDTEDLPRVGIWLMPDNESQGYLEHFIEKMIPANDSVWPLSQQYIEGIPQKDRKFTERRTQKAKIHAWLAAREKPGLFIGTAIKAKELHTGGELITKFSSWLQKLYKL
ncbi:MAG: hypothetical protein OXE42_15865 [Gammaproteobacteria bacterium]|nr:hypothetical protein [Gammaproteobacteria bacterium]